MLNKKKRITLTVACLIALPAFVLGLFVSQQVSLNDKTDMSAFHGTLLDKPRELSPFLLTGVDHLPFSNASLQGHWTFLFFGFTHCASVCPTTMAELAKMYRILGKKGIQPMPHVVMVSVDPERDHLSDLSHYVTAFDPHFYGAIGDEDAIQRMTKEMGIAYAKIASRMGGGFVQ
jgi:protein SCO1/2